jgi:transcription initiation factor IIE alpha subunit
MDNARKPAVRPYSSLFAGSEAARVIDFLLSGEQHQTMPEIHAGTQASMNRINKIIENLLDIDVIGIGARRIDHPQNKDETKDENTYYVRDDTDTGKAIRDLWYHLKRVLETEQFDSSPLD